MIRSGRTALVTGSTKNIGRATAGALAEMGYSVIINNRRASPAGEELTTKLNAAGGYACYFPADITQPEQVVALFERVDAQFGGLEILVNNVGGAEPRRFEDTDYNYWLTEFQRNFFSAVLCCHAALPLLKRSTNATIINVSSVRGLQAYGRVAIIAYSAAKAALNSFTCMLAQEVAPAITVNAVAPGVVATGPDDVSPLRNVFIRRSLIGREVSEREVVETILFLLSNRAVTGEVVVVDGGLHLAQESHNH